MAAGIRNEVTDVERQGDRLAAVPAEVARLLEERL